MRRERTQFVLTAKAFGSKISAAQAERIIMGEPEALPYDEQERRLKAMQQRHGWPS